MSIAFRPWYGKGGARSALGGLLAEPKGSGPRWTLRRRAVANALRAVAPEARVLVVATPEDGPGELMGLQALDVAAEANPALMRTVRRASPGAPGRLRHLDPQLAEAEAASREIDALWADALARAEPGLGCADPPALALAPARHTARLNERGLVWGEPPRRTAAGDVLLAHLLAAAAPLCDPDVPARVGDWVDAVADGTLGRADAVARARALLGRPAVGPAPAALERGRVLGDCPACAGPMRPRPRLAGLRLRGGLPLPRRGELTAVSGATCPACRAPMLRVDGGPPRCADRRECGG